MAESKNAAIRERVIDRCLSDQEKKYSTKDIMKACNEALEEAGEKIVTSLNTIRSDMRIIDQHWRNYGGAIVEEKDGRNISYHYEKRDFSIYKADITEDELNTINAALEVLSRFHGLPQYEWVDELSVSVKSSFLKTACSNCLIGFEQNSFAKGKQYLPELFDAISQHEVVNIHFQPQNAETATHTVHPYFLKEYNQRWFLLGWDEQTSSLNTITLDSIESISANPKEFIENNTVNLTEHFNKVIGVSTNFDQPTVPVKLWVSREQYPALEQQPLHESQQVLEHWDDGSKIVQIEVKENDELVQRLLAFGEKVVVIEPKSIHQKIQEHIWFAGENYNRFK